MKINIVSEQIKVKHMQIFHDFSFESSIFTRNWIINEIKPSFQLCSTSRQLFNLINELEPSRIRASRAVRHPRTANTDKIVWWVKVMVSTQTNMTVTHCFLFGDPLRSQRGPRWGKIVHTGIVFHWISNVFMRESKPMESERGVSQVQVTLATSNN